MIKFNKINLYNFIFFLSIILTIFIYYITSPVSSYLLAPLSRVIPLLQAFVIVTGSYSLGFFISKLLKFSFASKYRHFFILLIGEQLLIYLLLLMGAFKLLNSSYFIFIIFLLNIAVIFKQVSSLRNKTNAIRIFNWSSLYTKTLIFFLSATFLVLTANGSTPFSWYDSLVYHMAVPFEYFSKNQIFYIPGNVYANFPLNAEILNLSALLLGNEICCKFLIVIHIFLTLFLSGKFVLNESNDSNLRFLTMIIIGSNVIIFKQILQGNIDVFLMFAVTVYYIFLFEANFKNKSDYFFSGLFSAIILGYKYQAGPFFVFPSFIFICFKSYKNKTPIFFITHYLFGFIAFFSPWLIKNYIFTNNPVFPFLYNFFPETKDWSPFLNQVFFSIHQPSSINTLNNIWTFLQDLDGVIILFSFFYLIDIKGRLFLGMVLLSIPLWILLSKGHVRYILPVYPVLISISFISLKMINIRYNNKIIKISFIVFLFLRLNSLILLNSEAFQYFLGIKDVKSRLDSLSDPYFKATEYLNKTLSPGRNVLFLSEARSYGCNFKLSLATLFNKNVIENIISKSKNVNEVFNHLKKMGFTHIFFNRAELSRLQNFYGNHFPSIAGFSFEKNSQNYNLFIEVLKKISDNNSMPSDLNKWIILYEL